jgi:hypothetical protein
MMADATGEATGRALTLDFDRRLRASIPRPCDHSEAGLLAYRKLDDALGLTASVGRMLANARTGSNDRHALVEWLPRSASGLLLTLRPSPANNNQLPSLL